MNKLPKTDGIEQTPIEGMFQGNDKNGSGVLIGDGKEIPAYEGEKHGGNIAVNDMGKTEGEGADQGHRVLAGKKGMVAAKEKGPIKQFLGIHGKQGIKNDDCQPEGGLVAGVIKEGLGFGQGNGGDGYQTDGEKGKQNTFCVLAQSEKIAKGFSRKSFVTKEIKDGKDGAGHDKGEGMGSPDADRKKDGQDEKDTDKL
jgi:hypothetical protein